MKYKAKKLCAWKKAKLKKKNPNVITFSDTIDQYQWIKRKYSTSKTSKMIRKFQMATN